MNGNDENRAGIDSGQTGHIICFHHPLPPTRYTIHLHTNTDPQKTPSQHPFTLPQSHPPSIHPSRYTHFTHMPTLGTDYAALPTATQIDILIHGHIRWAVPSVISLVPQNAPPHSYPKPNTPRPPITSSPRNMHISPLFALRQSHFRITFHQPTPASSVQRPAVRLWPLALYHFPPGNLKTTTNNNISFLRDTADTKYVVQPKPTEGGNIPKSDEIHPPDTCCTRTSFSSTKPKYIHTQYLSKKICNCTMHNT